MTPPVDSVLIVGLGLMGGSLGLALKSRVPGLRVGGHDAALDVAERALALGAVDWIEPQGFPDLDRYGIVFAATPMSTIPRVLSEIGSRARAGTILTDLGSAKSALHRELAGLPPLIHYVGGHPMAGSDVEGLDGADANLYEDAVWLLTDPAGEQAPALETLRKVIESIGALVVEIDPEVHDRIVSLTSHLPYLAAVALVNALSARFPAPAEALELARPTAGRTGAHIDPGTAVPGPGSPFGLAAGGFLDTTRVAACPPGVFRDIVIANREHVLAALDLLRRELDEMAGALGRGDGSVLADTFRRARDVRKALPRFGRGFPVPRHELVLEAQDRPGFLGKVVTTLGDARINIKDFVLAFRDEEELESACLALSQAEFRVHRR